MMVLGKGRRLGFPSLEKRPSWKPPHMERIRSIAPRRTKNLRAVQLLRGHTKLESTVRYLGIEVDDALEMTEQTEV
jgi:hypothetical protein